MTASLTQTHCICSVLPTNQNELGIPAGLYSCEPMSPKERYNEDGSEEERQTCDQKNE